MLFEGDIRSDVDCPLQQTVKLPYQAFAHCFIWLSSRNFFQGGQNLLLCKLLLLCYCFRTNFREGQKFSRGANCLTGAPPAPPPPVEESQSFICLRLQLNNQEINQSHVGNVLHYVVWSLILLWRLSHDDMELCCFKEYAQTNKLVGLMPPQAA